MVDSNFEWTAIYEINGQQVVNGEEGFSSKELIADTDGCTNQAVQKIKEIWPGARVVKHDPAS